MLMTHLELITENQAVRESNRKLTNIIAQLTTELEKAKAERLNATRWARIYREQRDTVRKSWVRR